MRSMWVRLGVVLAAAPAAVGLTTPAASAAADPASVGVGCSDAGFWVTSVTARPGDVITLVGAGAHSDVCTLDLGSVATSAATTFRGDESLDITVLGPGSITVATSIMPPTEPTLTIVVPTEPGPGPADILQQVPVPSSGSCVDVADDAFRYGTSVAGGWTQSWAMWIREGRGGDVCTRTLHYDVSHRGWLVL